MNKRKASFLLTCLGLWLILVLFFACTNKINRAVSPGAGLIKGADYVGRQSCAMCHTEIVKDFDRTLHHKIKVPLGNEVRFDPVCESCHGPGSLHLEAGGGREAYIVDPVENPEACFQCHRNIQTRFIQKHHHPVESGKLSCMDCHNPHGQDIYSPSGAKTLMNREFCRRCHREQAEPHVFEHEALREGCTSCHNPHGSINEKLLVQRDNNLCLRCHGQIVSAGSISMGDFSHTSRVAQGVCWSSGCHTAVHGSNVNPHLRY